MKRYVVAGILVFVVSAIVLAPAGLVSRSLENFTHDLALVEPRGTIWEGQGVLISAGESVGQLNWQLQPWSLLLLDPTATWQLRSTALDLQGSITGTTELNVNVTGDIDLVAFEPLFNRYDLAIPGRVSVDDVVLGLDTQSRQLTHADGRLLWSGGQVRYVLSGILSESTLPQMYAQLSTTNQHPTADIYAQGEPIRLMQAQITPDGFIKIGISKMFTKVLNRPWPGSDPDHAIVLEVEEQLL